MLKIKDQKPHLDYELKSGSTTVKNSYKWRINSQKQNCLYESLSFLK